MEEYATPFGVPSVKEGSGSSLEMTPGQGGEGTPFGSGR